MDTFQQLYYSSPLKHCKPSISSAFLIILDCQYQLHYCCLVTTSSYIVLSAHKSKRWGEHLRFGTEWIIRFCVLFTLCWYLWPAIQFSLIRWSSLIFTQLLSLTSFIFILLSIQWDTAIAQFSKGKNRVGQPPCPTGHFTHGKPFFWPREAGSEVGWPPRESRRLTGMQSVGGRTCPC